MENKSKHKPGNKPLTVHELADLAGISVRALHYYDSIGLLHPSRTTEKGYRLYGEESIARLQEIMLFRELEFPLKDIKAYLADPGLDRKRILEDQIRMLEMKRDHLDALILHANRMKVKEETKMDFKAYDKTKMEDYRKLAKETWGKTEAYKEFEEKDASYSEKDKRQNAEDLMSLFYEFGDLKALDPGDEKVQAQVKKLQDFITAKYYTCTDTILAGLGKLYSAGGEMTENIDVAGGKGTASFVTSAIDIFVRK